MRAHCGAVNLDDSNDDEVPAGGPADRMRRGFMNVGRARSDAEVPLDRRRQDILLNADDEAG